MAGFMGDDEDDGGMGLQMIPKAGAQGMGAQPMMQQNPNAVNMRPALAQAGADNMAAKQNWETALRRNVGGPVQNAATGVADKLDQMFGNGAKQMPAQQMGGHAPSEDDMDAIRQQMLAERAANGGQISPESMARFQRLKAAMMGGQKPGAIAAQPDPTPTEE
jgi:hypothetical protein